MMRRPPGAPSSVLLGEKCIGLRERAMHEGEESASVHGEASRTHYTHGSNLYLTRMNRHAIRLFLALALPTVAAAQGFPPSQRQTITQNVALTKIEISYGRPVARGRELFGKLVPWNEVWHPGADSATRVSIDHDITVSGHPLKAGEYSLWLIARDGQPWTVIFNSAARVFHRPYGREATEALRLDVTPETFSHVESLTIDFPKVLSDDAILRIQWGTTAVSLNIKAPYRP